MFTGLEKGKKYYFYLRLTGDASFEDHVVTSKGAAISTSTESAQVWLQNPVNSLEYNGSPVVPQLKFAAGSATCLEEAVEYTWSAKVQSNIVPLDGPPKDVGSYQVEVSIRPEYSDDYTILGKNTFTFDIASKWIWGIPSNLFTAVDRVYDGTGKAILSYNEEELRRAIELEMAPGDTTRGMVVVASGQFSQWNASYNVTIEPEQAYENKPVSVSIRMLGPGANNYLVSHFGGTLTATIFKADRTIAAPGVASDDGGNITLDIPGVTGVDDTAGTDGVISYAVADTDQAPDAASALWQTSPDFSVLADGSEYYLFARITGGKNYHDAVSPGALYVSSLSHSHNWDSSNWTTDATAHWHECQAEDCPIKDNAKKNGYGLHRFTQWAQDPDTGEQSRTCQDCGYHESTYLPMSQISMGTWTWTKTYYDQPDPLLSNLKTPALQIFAMDRDEDLVSLGYVCMATPSDPAQFAESAWHLLPMESDQTGTLSEEVVIPESLLSGGYVYVRAKDAAGNVHYASTPKLVFDTVAPKIKIDGVAVTSGQTYCTPQTAAVSDDLELASVTLDGKDIAAMGAIRLEAGEHTLVAVDKAGNRATVTVRVNNGHTNKEWSIPPSCVDVGITITTCTVCGYTTTTPDAPQGHTWDSEYTVDREPTCTEQGVKSLHCTKCGAGKEFQTIPAVGHTLEPDWHKGASHHWQICSTCGERVNEMSHQGTGLWIRETGRAAGAGVEEHMECAVCHAIITRRYQPYSDDPYVRYGTVEKQTEVKPGAPEAQWSDSLDAALKAVGFEETDLTKHNNAVSHKLVLSISPLVEGTAIPGQTEIQQTAETQLKRKDAEFLYVDVSLLKYTYKENGGNADDTPELIHQTEKPLEIMLQIPEELQTIPEGMTRTFFLLYAHEQNGKMESAILEPHKNSGNGKLYFSTDRFSTYAIAYVDTPVGEDPPSVITPTPTPTSKPTPPSPSIPISPSTPTSSPTSTPSPAPSSDPSVDHIDYIHGHKGQFRPNDYMSRAEAAQILYRLLADKPQVELAFDDVSEAAWYSEAVSVLAGLGIVKGIGNHRFDPERPVTRGEFAAMAARFMDLPLSEGQSSFPDVPDGAWYSGPVNACESAGWIKGYPDGLFRPMDRITRAQAVTIVNRMLKRAADEQAVAKRTMPFSDVPRTHWAYDDILEAAVAHKSVIQSDGSEIWE